MTPLELIRHPSGVVFLRSDALAALGVPHAFSTRLGGVSAAPCDSLDCAGEEKVSDTFSARGENRRRLLDAAGFGTRTVAPVRLVHGAEGVVDERQLEARGEGPQQADALVTASTRAALLVTVADCVPILLACPQTGAVAAVHAGWRGIVSGVIGAAVSTMASQFRAEPRRVLAAIGPCIGIEAFEVGEEVAGAFLDSGLGGCVMRGAGLPKPHINLFAAAREQLRRAGVPIDRIDGSPRCTAAEPELFFSHRRDSGRTGRNAAVIGRA